jgi:hypothetical protein
MIETVDTSNGQGERYRGVLICMARISHCLYSLRSFNVPCTPTVGSCLSIYLGRSQTHHPAHLTSSNSIHGSPFLVSPIILRTGLIIDVN